MRLLLLMASKVTILWFDCLFYG